MSLLTQASLVLTPTSYKANKLYSVVPSSGNGDLTTTRATTATRVNSSGLVENVATGIPRVDYTGGVSNILLEPQRTNLILRSQDFSNAIWSKNTTTILSTNNIAPDGTLTASKLTASIGNPTLQQIITGTIGLQYTSSFWVRRVSGTSQVFLRCGDVFPVQNINPTYEWQLFSYSAIATTTIIRCGIGFLSPTENTDVIEIWGSQLELGSYATSYIPTTTSTVTRNLDDISKTGVSTDILNPSEGTFYVEISALSNDLTARIISINDGTNFNNIQIQFSNVSNIIRLDTYGQTGVGTTANYRSSVTVSDTTSLHKCLIKWGAAGKFGYVDGVKYTLGLADGTGTGIPTNLNRIDFKQYWGGNYFYGKCKGMQIYKTALTDAECASLTTL